MVYALNYFQILRDFVKKPTKGKSVLIIQIE